MPEIDEEAAEAMNKIAVAAAAAVLAQMPAAPNMTPAILNLMDGNVPSFSGEKGTDAPAHYLKFHDHLRDLLNLSAADAAIRMPATQIEKFRKTLVGKARKWFDRIPMPTTMAGLRTVFLDKYSKDPSKAEDFKTISNAKMRPDEKVSQFGDRLSEAMARQGCVELIKEFFLNGLPNDMQMWVRGREIPTFERALETAKEFEQYQSPTSAGTGLQTQFIMQDNNAVKEILEGLDDLRAMNLLNLSKNRDASPHPSKWEDRSKNRSPSPKVHFRPNEKGDNNNSYQRGRSPDNRFRPPGSPDNRYRPPENRGWSPNQQRGRSPNRQDWSNNRSGRSADSWYSERGRSPNRDDWNKANNWAYSNPSPYDRDRNSNGPNDQRRSPTNYQGYNNRGQSPNFRRGQSPQGRFPSNPRNQADKGFDISTALCWNCGEKGHLYRNCPRGRKDPTFQRRTERAAMRSFLKELEEENLPGSL